MAPAEADPARFVGFVLIDGLNASEEAVNAALGNAAPFLSFVGGSAGDDLEFRRTRVFCDGEESDHGAVLLLVEMDAPFAVLKTCSFEPTPHLFAITKADAATRTVYEANGRPVLEAYAEAVGVEPGGVDSSVFVRHPLGITIDGQPWIRSPQQATDDGSLRFYCQVLEGVDLHVMTSGDLVADTRRAVDEARSALGGTVSGGVVFNCVLRRLELDALDAHEGFLGAFAGIPAAGFHTYGESWLAHINQTCTGVLVG